MHRDPAWILAGAYALVFCALAFVALVAWAWLTSALLTF